MEDYEGNYQNGNTRGVDFQFQRLAQSIGTNIQKILQNVSSIQRMISQIGTPQDNQQLQNLLYHTQHATGQLAKETTTQLRELNELSAGGPGAENRRWRLQRERLRDDFTKALNSFQTAQKTVAAKEKELLSRAKNKNLGPADYAQETNLIEVDETKTGPGKTQMLLEEESNIEQLQERERSIRQLESDILDVNTIFKDLATMIHEQGEVVDTIEHYVESAHMRVREGTEQLQQAERYKNKSRKKKVILAIILIIVLAIIIGIIAWQAN